MKTLIFGILSIVSYLGILVCPIWAIIEFILYLVKDKEFNWNSLWFFISSIILFIVFLILAAYFSNKESKKNYVNSKSKWQQRLDEMKSKRVVTKK